MMTSMALIVGLGSANTGKTSIIAGLLIIGIADNLSDSLGIHIHEECDTKATEAFSLSASNYVTRLVIVCSFIAIVAVLPYGVARAVTLAWGVVLLSVLTYFIAKARSARPAYEIALHLFVAAVVVASSGAIGVLIRRWL